MINIVKKELEFDDEFAKNLIDEAEIFHDNRLLIVFYDMMMVVIV